MPTMSPISATIRTDDGADGSDGTTKALGASETRPIESSMASANLEVNETR